MRLYLTAKTEMKDLVIDYIEIKQKCGKTAVLTWDESDFGIKNGEFNARYKGVYIDDAYGNGRLEELKDMQIVDVGAYTDNDEPIAFEITHIDIEDDDDELCFDGLSYYHRLYAIKNEEVMFLEDLRMEQQEQM